MVGLIALCLLGGGDLWDPPSLVDLSVADEEEAAAVGEYIAVEAFALWTRFDDGLKIQEAWGAGIDFRAGIVGDHLIDLRLGYAGWNTENDEDDLPEEGVWVRQYRVGVGFTVPVRQVIDVGFWINGGLYRFRRDEENDSSPFIEFMGAVGFRPVPNVRIGIVAMSTHTQSSFNREHTHLFHNYTAGPSVEVRF